MMLFNYRNFFLGSYQHIFFIETNHTIKCTVEVLESIGHDIHDIQGAARGERAQHCAQQLHLMN